MASVSRTVPKTFSLTRWFAALSLVTLVAISAMAAFWLSRFLSEEMLRRDAVLTMEFVRSLVLAEHAVPYFRHPGSADQKALEENFRHLARMPDVVRANVYWSNKAVLWSSDPSMVGRQFPDNPELDEALAGELVVHSGKVDADRPRKSEHVHLAERTRYYVESYIPVRDEASGTTVGVVEVYRVPDALFDAIHSGRRIVWTGAVAASLLLYGALFWIVLRADRVMRAQRLRLLEAETLAVVGEMGSAVAHGIRNPLASIRSSAELLIDSSGQGYAESAGDIIAEVDRLEKWVRELLGYVGPLRPAAAPVDLGAVLAEVLEGFRRELERRGVRGEARVAKDLPHARGDPALLGQVFASLVANALEAMSGGGRLTLRARTARGGREVEVMVEDTGSGVAPEQMDKVFRPFHTSKARGLGLGLPLARRIIERLGGTIELRSTPGVGTSVEVRLPAAK
jgi:signal transduction histidine kinase